MSYERLVQDEKPVLDPSFVDVYAGAGGLSLGLLQAGWQGLFAIEKSPMAFETLKYNLVAQQSFPCFNWPDWLPSEAFDIESCLKTYKDRLQQLKGLPLLAGGPPCQGFSASGRRKHDDERNRLFESYLDLVRLVEPKLILVENVRGFATSFTKTEKGKKGSQISDDQFNAHDELIKRLKEEHYKPFARYAVRAATFGVPQWRPRYILIAIRNDFMTNVPGINPLKILDDLRLDFLKDHALPTDTEVTLGQAISDLEMKHGHVPCIEPGMAKFQQGVYGPIESQYQTLMRKRRDGGAIPVREVADSHRFPNHTPEIVTRFRRIISEFRQGTQLSDTEREQLAINKHRIAPLAAEQACHTLTSLPDDLVHYCEPRIPTVREYARIQSFPDWFQFKSKYTTGDKNRRVEVPRYTQVANAVPPLLAKALGLALLEVYETLTGRRHPTPEMLVEQPIILERGLTLQPRLFEEIRQTH